MDFLFHAYLDMYLRFVFVETINKQTGFAYGLA